MLCHSNNLIIHQPGISTIFVDGPAETLELDLSYASFGYQMGLTCQ